MENPIKMDDLEGTPFFGNTHIYIYIQKTYDSRLVLPDAETRER